MGEAAATSFPKDQIKVLLLENVHDLVEIVLDDDGAVRVGGFAHALLAQHFFELLRIAGVIGDGGRRIFELVAGEDANHRFVRTDHLFVE